MPKRSCNAAGVAAGQRQLKRRGKGHNLLQRAGHPPLLAFKQLGVAVRHAFSCDSARACQQLINHCMTPEHLFTNIKECPVEEKPACDVYFTGFPRTPSVAIDQVFVKFVMRM